MHNTSSFDSFLSCPPSFLDVPVSYDVASLATAVVSLPIGVILATLGYRLRHVTYFLCGFITGTFITYSIVRDQIDNMQLPSEGVFGVAAIGGLVLGLLCLGVQVLGLFVVGMDASFLLAACCIGVTAHFLTFEERVRRMANANTSLMFSSPFHSRWLPIGCIILACLLGGLVSLFRPKHLLMTGSSLIGSAIIMLTFGYFLEVKNPLRPVRFIAAAIIGTRYMQTHYGKYLFTYVPFALPFRDRQTSDSIERNSESSFTPNSLTQSAESSSPITTTVKEDVVPTFLCWSDFVLLMCWLIFAALFGAMQMMCSICRRNRRRSLRKGGKRRRRHGRLSSHHKPKNVSSHKSSSRRSSDSRAHTLREQDQHNDLPPYAQAARATVSYSHNSIVPNAEAWLSRTNFGGSPNIAGVTVRQPSGFVSISAESSRQHREPVAFKWMPAASRSSQNDPLIMTPAAVASSTALLATTPAKTSAVNTDNQSSPFNGAGHLLRMRRSFGDVLSRDFISTCVAPRPLPPLDEPGSSQC